MVYRTFLSSYRVALLKHKRPDTVLLTLVSILFHVSLPDEGRSLETLVLFHLSFDFHVSQLSLLSIFSSASLQGMLLSSIVLCFLPERQLPEKKSAFSSSTSFQVTDFLLTYVEYLFVNPLFQLPSATNC